jgi:hypothetical protein
MMKPRRANVFGSFFKKNNTTKYVTTDTLVGIADLWSKVQWSNRFSLYSIEPRCADVFDSSVQENNTTYPNNVLP